ncbi:hypothetical protein IHE44_0013019 [Lamprotornis superbus]|uniref:small monomeric GTPase n=1 Tax=Lamprotornis superbus TaxID=245042 RepID=A0A835P4I5_9PASS|nr:hypothetical protein IHE44_0013019 [Lamprotornis superbus]
MGCNLYSRHIQVDGEMLAIQVQDTPGVQLSNSRPFIFQIHEHSLDCNEQLNRCIRWADALVIVFSITDYKSFELLSHLYHHVRQLHPGNMVPVVIVANKADLLHIKEVEPQQGLQLANMLGCTFYEVSVSENYNNVFNAFHLLCKEVNKQQITSTPERRRTSLIPRPKSPNMQDLKRRFKQALSAKLKTGLMNETIAHHNHDTHPARLVAALWQGPIFTPIMDVLSIQKPHCSADGKYQSMKKMISSTSLKCMRPHKHTQGDTEDMHSRAAQSYQCCHQSSLLVHHFPPPDSDVQPAMGLGSSKCHLGIESPQIWVLRHSCTALSRSSFSLLSLDKENRQLDNQAKNRLFSFPVSKSYDQRSQTPQTAATELYRQCKLCRASTGKQQRKKGVRPEVEEGQPRLRNETTRANMLTDFHLHDLLILHRPSRLVSSAQRIGCNLTSANKQEVAIPDTGTTLSHGSKVLVSNHSHHPCVEPGQLGGSSHGFAVGCLLWVEEMSDCFPTASCKAIERSPGPVVSTRLILWRSMHSSKPKENM